MISFLMYLTLPLCILAIAAMFIYRKAYQQRNERKFRTWLWICFISCSLLVVVNLVEFFIFRRVFDLLFAGLWGYFTWREFQIIRQLPD